MNRLAGLNAVVTGGSSGIGRAIAEAYAREGARVLLTFRAAAEAARVLAETIRAAGGQAETAQADLGDTANCRALAAEAQARLGRVDVWVNNAGADILTTEAAGWDWERKLDLLLRVDLRGTIACCYAIAPHMQQGPGGGVILNMGWDHALAGMAGENPQLFAAVKGGVLAFSKSLARALAPGVRVNALAPGWIETQFGATAPPDFHAQVAESTPLARWGRPEDVAEAAVYLASPEAAFVTGQTLLINGGVVM